MKTTLHCNVPFRYLFPVLFLFLFANQTFGSTSILFDAYQTKAACSSTQGELKVQVFLLNNTSTQAENCTITVTGNNYSYSITLYQIIPTTSGNLDGNITSGKWATFTGLSAGSYTISITTTSVQGQPTTSTFSILTYLPYSDYFDKQNSSDNNNGNTILNLDLKTDFCAVGGNGTTNDALSCYNASLFINGRKGAVNLTIPSGTYLINIQDPAISLPTLLALRQFIFDFIKCTDLTITGATGSGGSPASIFKFADGQKYGCYDPTTNAPIICDPSIKPANPGTLFNFYECKNIVLSNIEGDGNNSKMIFGGSNNGGAPNVLGGTVNDIQVAATGLRIDGYNMNFTVTDCNFNNFCLDGITINGDVTADPTSGAIISNFLTKDQNLDYNLFQNIDLNNNSRCGISISAGKYIKLLECDIYNTGQGTDASATPKPLANAPATGIDIEPNGYLPQNAPLDGCSQIVIEKCSVKYSFAHALTILSKIHPSDPNADFVSQWITSKESYYADYDDNALLIEGDLQTQATIESNGMNVTFEDDKIVGSFWRGCYPNAALDQPKFIRVTFLEDDFSGPNGTQYQNYNKLFYSHNHCQQMFFDECTFTVNHAKSPIYLFTRDAANVDTSKYALFKDCTFNYENNHVENYNNTLNGIVFVGCKFQGKTTFNNNTSEVKNIKAAGVILNGSIDPCTPSLFKLDKNMIFTYNNSHSYDDYNAGTGQTILVTASVNKPFNIGPPTTINSIPTLTYANFEIPDGSTFRSSVYENYYNPGGVLSTSPPEIYIGEKSRFLMYGTTGTTQFLAHHPNPNGPSLILKNEGQFILAPNVNVAVHNLSIQNPNTTNITYFDPGVVKPTWWTNNNNDITASGSNCYYTPLITSQLNFPVTNPPSTAFDQVKWNEKFTVYYKLTFGNNCLGSINYLIRGGSGNYTVLIDGQNNTQNLSFGAHTFSVQDVNNPTCVFTFGFDLKFDGIGLNPNCVNSNGYIFANKGGVPNLTYSISPNIGTQNPAGTFSNLPAGTYIITASGSGCSITTTITLYQPNSNHCCSTTSNPNAGSNIASMPYIILLPNTQVANLTAANLLSNYGSNGVIQGKKFYIDGILTIDADITFNQCDIYFTTGSKIAVNAGINLHIAQNSTLQASCAMWDGIYAEDPTAEITLENCTIQDMENGVVLKQGAKAGITNSDFKNCNRSIAIFENNAITNCSITGNTFTADGNMLAPYANLKPEHGIYIYNSASLQIGDIGAPNDGNVFENLQNGIKILNETVMVTIGQGPNQQMQLIPAPSSYIQLKNNTMSGITKNANSTADEAGVGVYAEANSLVGGRPRLLITNSVSPSAQSAPTFQNCEYAVYLKQASADVFNQHIDRCGIGIGAIKCEGEKYNISGNYLNQTYWNIVKSGDESTLGFLVNNNTITMPGDEPNLIGLPPIGILSAYSSKIHQGNSQINTNGIRISEGLAGIGISLNNGKDDRIEGNQIHFLNTTVETVIGIPKLIGIYSNSSDHPRILNNSVDNNFLNDPTATQFINNNNTGIYVHENINSVLHCNLTNFTRFGILATGANGNSANYDQTAGNFMNNSHANMFLLRLQVEGSLGQIGSNNPLTGNYDANNTFSPNLQFGPLNNVYRYTLCPQSNTSDEIVTDVNRLTQAQSSASNSNANDCRVQVPPIQSFTSGFLCGDENPWPDLDLQYAMLVAAENTNYIDFEDGARQSDQEWVYRWVEENPDLRTQFPILDSFYLNRYSGLTGQLNRIDEAMALLGDSALRAQPTLWLQAHGNVVNQNNALDVNAPFGQYAQQMNTFLLRDMLPDAPEFSENERDAISTVALSCPYTHGNAVYKARVLYARFAPPAHYDELVICNSQGVYKNGPSKLDDLIYTLNHAPKKNALNLEDDLVKLYPNPTHQNLTIEGDNLKTIRITDLLGREVFHTELQSKMSRQQIELPVIQPGIYLYSIHTINDTKSGKLLIE